MRRQRQNPRQLRRRLECLRESCQYLRARAGIGHDLRLLIAAAGSPTWAPSGDLSWRSWIESNGDEYARALLMAIDEELEKCMARKASPADLQADDESSGEAKR